MGSGVGGLFLSMLNVSVIYVEFPIRKLMFFQGTRLRKHLQGTELWSKVWQSRDKSGRADFSFTKPYITWNKTRPRLVGGDGGVNIFSFCLLSSPEKKVIISG